MPLVSTRKQLSLHVQQEAPVHANALEAKLPGSHPLHGSDLEHNSLAVPEDSIGWCVVRGVYGLQVQNRRPGNTPV